MQFFTKYKDLFDVPEGLSMPASRLRLDNTLFIDKPYVNTYTQQYTLNSKLRELKKDYTAFENEISALGDTTVTPKRSNSRKGKSSEQRSQPIPQKYNQNQSEHRMQPWAKQKQEVLHDKAKRQQWLQEEQSNILKHSQMDHIFNSKLNNIYQLDDIQNQSLPKLAKLSDSSTFPVRKAKQNNFTIKQRSRPTIEAQKETNRQSRVGPSGTANETAAQRREKATNTLQFRRKRLEQLLRHLW